MCSLVTRRSVTAVVVELGLGDQCINTRSSDSSQCGSKGPATIEYREEASLPELKNSQCPDL